MIIYDEDRFYFFLCTTVPGTVAKRAVIPAAACSAWTGFVYLAIQFDLIDMPFMVSIWTHRTWLLIAACLTLIINIRLRQALDRFWQGAGNLYMMNGEFFQAASNLFAFSRKVYMDGGEKAEKVKNFRQTLVRLLSYLSAECMEELSKNTGCQLDVIDDDGVYSLDPEVTEWLSQSHLEGFNTEFALLHMIEVLITDAFIEGLTPIGPPIYGRPFQNLSRGFVRYLDAKKVSITPYPFCFQQLIFLGLTVHTLLSPFVLIGLGYFDHGVSEVIFVMVGSALPTFILWGVTLACGEIEMPFGDRENDLPLQTFQDDMNRALLMLAQEKSDFLASVEEEALIDAVDVIEATPAIQRRQSRMAEQALTKRKTTTFVKQVTILGGNVTPSAPGSRKPSIYHFDAKSRKTSRSPTMASASPADRRGVSLHSKATQLTGMSTVSRRTAKTHRLTDVLASRHGARMDRGMSGTSMFTVFDAHQTRPSQGMRRGPTGLSRLSAHPPVQKDAQTTLVTVPANVRHQSGVTVDSDFTFTDMGAYEKQGKSPASTAQTRTTTGGEDRADPLLPTANGPRQRSKDGNWV